MTINICTTALFCTTKKKMLYDNLFLDTKSICRTDCILTNGKKVLNSWIHNGYMYLSYKTSVSMDTLILGVSK